MALGYKYYRQGQTGWDANRPRTCPKCGSKSYSSAFLDSKTSSADCPNCGKEF